MEVLIYVVIGLYEVLFELCEDCGEIDVLCVGMLLVLVECKYFYGDLYVYIDVLVGCDGLCVMVVVVCVCGFVYLVVIDCVLFDGGVCNGFDWFVW